MTVSVRLAHVDYRDAVIADLADQVAELERCLVDMTIHQVFEEASASFIASAELVLRLCRLEDRPWATSRKPCTN